MRLSTLVCNLKSQSLVNVLVVMLIATGLGAFGTTYSVYHIMSSNPMSDVQHDTRYVTIDDWSPDKDLQWTPPLLSYQDGTALLQFLGASKGALTYDSKLVAQQPNSSYVYELTTRATTPDFFSIFHTQFKYGAPWSFEEDVNRTAVVVLSSHANKVLFDSSDSVGQLVYLDGKVYTVVGVLTEFEMTPKVYDLHVDPYAATEDLYIPFHTAIEHDVLPHGRLLGWRDEPMSGFRDVLTTSMIWLQLWVQFDSKQDMEAFNTALAGYTEQQSLKGRMLRGHKQFELLSSAQWLERNQVVNGDSKLLLMLAIVFLVICLVCVSALLFASYATRRRALNVYRALGASKRYVSSMLFAELTLLALGGCVLGMLLTALGLSYMEKLYGSSYQQVASLDLTPIVIAAVCCLFGVILASVLPISQCCHSKSIYIRR
ncbi:ABC transporter permease [Pseudoalteromonas sp. MMG022]|uniref:ABC transporter permease n=1 Tax=Pseudoalteromonas sp. MMG022 TaxID=2909978 RepID=UPI001F2B254E|nr:ABC transporter permease [Pseudoalteromonas sp. MMG022]MCF6434902.1 ABC transporter permease [Pseudoalteromonas sp. MMG022]